MLTPETVPIHLLDALLNDYKAECDPEDRTVWTIDAFIEHAKEWLVKNPAVGVVYLDSGLGFRLRNGVTVSLGDTTPYQMRDEGIHVNQAGGHSRTIPSQSVQIT